jgi:diacylglycerol kinase family enzyme
VVVNPTSGGGRVGTWWKEKESEVLGVLGYDSQVIWTTERERGGPQSVRKITEGIDQVIVVGGDGTLSEVVHHLGEAGLLEKIKLGVIPAGRGDDFFRTLVGKSMIQREQRYQFAIEWLRGGDTRKVDVVRSNWEAGSRHWINVVSFGFGGRVVERVKDRVGILGQSPLGATGLSYLLQTFAGLSEYRPINLKIRVDKQEVFNGPFFTGFILNGRFNAGGIEWLKGVRIDDGQLHLIGFQWPKKEWMKEWVPALVDRTWKNIEGVMVFTGTEIEIEVLGEVPTYSWLEWDGDPMVPGSFRAIQMQSLPKILRVVGNRF